MRWIELKRFKIWMFSLSAAVLCACSSMEPAGAASALEKEDIDMNMGGGDKRGYSESRLMELQKKVISYLTEKYDEEFTATGGGLKGILDKRDFIVAVSASHPDLVFKTYMSEDGSLEDEYYGLIKREETENLIRELAEPVLGPCLVSAQMYRMFGEEYTAGMTVKDAVVKLKEEDSPVSISANIFVKSDGEEPGESAGRVEAFRTAITEAGLDGDFTIFYVTDGWSGGLTREQMKEIQRSNEKYDYREFLIVSP